MTKFSTHLRTHPKRTPFGVSSQAGSKRPRFSSRRLAIEHDCPGEDEPFYLVCMRQTLEEKRRKNSRYSLRAMARWIGIHPSALSRILAGKQELSTGTCLLTLKRLNLPPDLRERFIDSYVKHRAAKIASLLHRAFESTTEH